MKIDFSKDNPMRIEKLEELKHFENTFLRKNYAIYICPKCNKEKKSKMMTLVQKNELLCHECSIKKSVIEKYGSREEYYKKSAETFKNTCLKKYGVENVFQLENIKEKIKNKIETNDPGYKNRNKKLRETCLERYGVENGGWCSKQSLEKIMKTKKERYGDPFYTNREKSSETFKRNHQTKESLEPIKEKRNKTIIEKYGSIENCYKHATEKSKQTYLRKYGVEHPSQLPEKRELGFGPFKYYYDDYVFDSSWELAYYVWLKDQNIDFVVHPFPIEYYDEYKQKKRMYFPDFIVEDEIIEIKGDFLINKKDGTLKDIGKQKILEDYEVAIFTEKEIRPYIKYAESKVGDLTKFRKKKSFTKM